MRIKGMSANDTQLRTIMVGLGFVVALLLGEPARAQQVVGACTVACNGSGNLLLAFDDGTAYVGARAPCVGCPGTDSLYFTTASFGNILASAGRAGDRLLAMFYQPSVCGYLVGITQQGYVLIGTPEQPWGTAMEGQSVFARLGMPSQRVVGGGSDGSAVMMVTEAGDVFAISASGPQFFFPNLKGRIPGFQPTTTTGQSWGSLKASFR